ncbi:MAG: hypothetical protein IT363_01345 [Methanoregulaceae archaeon]|nr:hypothetical protein [Methanoregulaceae archaeon]
MSPIYLLPLLAGVAASPLESYAPYESAVPNPTRLLGYGPGERFTLLPQQEQVLQAIVAKSSARSMVEPYGASTEGRPLRLIVIASPENRRRLDAIRKDIQTLADGSVDEAILRRTPTVVWINQAIHGDEAASFESAMWLVYNLSASRHPEIQRLLKDTVVIVNPCYNPDGRERFATWASSVVRGDADPASFEQREPRFVDGRTNHYRFDLNRDRVSMSQLETRQEIAAFRRWNPQVYVDQHGEVDTYHFPPAALSVHARVDRARYHRWAEVFGRETARAFDAQGYPYYVKDIFDLYYPGYLDSWATLSGAIGMTHETNAQMVARRDPDGVVRTLRGGMERHFVAALGVIRAAAENREGLLRSFAEFKQKAAAGTLAGKRKAFVAASDDPQPLDRMAKILEVSGIRVQRTFAGITGEGTSLWSGESEKLPTVPKHLLIVPMAQPQAALAMALLETDSDFEKAFTDEQLRRRDTQGTAYAEGSEFYDLTAWSLPLIHGVSAWWLDRIPSVAGGADAVKPADRDSTIGWALRPGLTGTAIAARLLAAGIRVQQSPAEMTVGGQTFPSGTFLIPVSRNDEEVGVRMRKVLGDDANHLMALKSAYPDTGRMNPGSEAVASLRPMKLGVLFGDAEGPTDFGGAWYVLERELDLPFTAMSGAALRGSLDAYSAIIAPEGADVTPAKLREWVQAGGCLVLLGGDPNRGAYLKLEAQRAVENPGSIPGSLFSAQVDRRHFLAYGLEDRPVAALMGGGRYFVATDGGTAVKVADQDRLLISGWAWPEKTERAIRNAAIIHAESVGRGRVVWFATDPTDRALLAGHWGYLLNALVSGPRL